MQADSRSDLSMFPVLISNCLLLFLFSISIRETLHSLKQLSVAAG